MKILDHSRRLFGDPHVVIEFRASDLQYKFRNYSEFIISPTCLKMPIQAPNVFLFDP